MGDALETVANGVGVVIERINAPYNSNVRVRMESNSVNHRVTHCGVRVFGINPCSQR